MLADFQVKPTLNPEGFFCIETISGEAYSLIENISKVSAASKIIRDIGFLNYEEVQQCNNALLDLERKLRSDLRKLMLEETPYEVSPQLARMIKQEIESAKTSDLSFLD